jgi:hypothetical protein
MGLVEGDPVVLLAHQNTVVGFGMQRLADMLDDVVEFFLSHFCATNGLET